MPEFFFVKYDQLQAVSAEFHRQADCIAEMIKQLRSGKNKLDQSWKGDGYDKFNQEMEGDVFKRLQRLQAALEQAGKIVKQIDDLMHRSEMDAQKAWPTF